MKIRRRANVEAGSLRAGSAVATPQAPESAPSVPGRGLELRNREVKFSCRDEGGVRHIVGYPAVFNSPTSEEFEEWYGFREVIAPGAFASSIAQDDIRCLWNHQSSFVLGRNKAGTLQLVEDETGLYFDCVPPDTTWARDLLVSIDRGDVSQGSFQFQVLEETWDRSGPVTVRKLSKLRLFEVSPVTFPAYPGTQVKARAAAGLDLDALAAACSRIQSGTPQVGDRDLVRSATRSLIDIAGPTPAQRLELLQRRLDLAAREI